MSAKVTVEFNDGRKALWALPSDPDGAVAVNLLESKLGQPNKIREPLDFQPLGFIPNGYTADSSNGRWTFLIVVRDYGRDVVLYQMPTGESLCPVNIDRAERFQRFSVEFGDVIPWGQAMCAAQDWDDAENGWGADDDE